MSDYGFISGGELKNHTGQDIIEVGLCVSSTDPALSYDDITDTSIYPCYLSGNSFTCYLDICDPGTTYYYRAYVVYGSEANPIVKQGEIKIVTTTGAGSGSGQVSVSTKPGYINNYYGDYLLETGGYISILSGNPTITEKGICYSWSTSTPNYWDSDIKYCGSGSDDFDAEIYLQDDYTTYYYRAYAIYDETVVYGSVYFISTGSKTGSY